MGRLDYWHPVLDSRELPANRAVGVIVAGRALALFRARGRPGAVDDRCAHRRMKLSLGTVREDRLVCPYHGWSYDREGRGESPSAPSVQACVPSYDCAEANGVVGVAGQLDEALASDALGEPACVVDGEALQASCGEVLDGRIDPAGLAEQRERIRDLRGVGRLGASERSDQRLSRARHRRRSDAREGLGCCAPRWRRARLEAAREDRDRVGIARLAEITERLDAHLVRPGLVRELAERPG